MLLMFSANLSAQDTTRKVIQAYWANLSTGFTSNFGFFINAAGNVQIRKHFLISGGAGAAHLENLESQVDNAELKYFHFSVGITQTWKNVHVAFCAGPVLMRGTETQYTYKQGWLWKEIVGEKQTYIHSGGMYLEVKSAINWGPFAVGMNPYLMLTIDHPFAGGLQFLIGFGKFSKGN